MKPLKPTLRVETDFNNERDHLREEARKSIALRRSHLVHLVPPKTNVHCEPVWRRMENFLAKDLYVPFDPRPFRKTCFSQPKNKPRYRAILTPIKIFDEVDILTELYIEKK